MNDNLKRKNQQVTISQVAKEAGVSSQTVSRVINNRQEITPETRRHVQDVIKRLGYRPNAIARSLSQRRSQTLGVAASGLEYYGPSHRLIGVEQGATQKGFSILLNLLHQTENENVEQIVNGLISRQVEGIIWAVPEIVNNRVWFREIVPQLAIPVIFLNTQSNETLHVVEVNNRNGGYMATKHLLERGYRKIGLIAGPLTWWTARERRRGWQEIDRTRLGELLPLLFEAAEARDEVAQSLLIQLGTEVGITANALIRRLGMEKQDIEVVLAGSVFKGKGHLLPETATYIVHTIAPRARVMRPPYEPVVGAAFLALEAISVTISSDQQAQLRRTLPGELLLA